MLCLVNIIVTFLPLGSKEKKFTCNLTFARVQAIYFIPTGAILVGEYLSVKYGNFV
jgi:hypothetical protein